MAREYTLQRAAVPPQVWYALTYYGKKTQAV